MKRVICLLLAAVLCLALPSVVSAAPADAVKRYELRVDNTGSGGVFCPNAVTAFWEYPLLEAGQCRLDGTVTFANYSAVSVQTGILITLPYENEAALGYLNYVRIRVVRDDGTTVYDGPYCRIADNGRLDNGYVCAPAGEVSYRISMWCAYDYVGAVSAESAGITWQFATSEYVAPPIGEAAPSTPSEVWVLGVLVAGVVVLGICLLPRFGTKKRRSGRKRR